MAHKFENPTSGAAPVKEQESQGGSTEIKTYTEEEVQKLLQQEADRRVNQALKTAKDSWKEELEQEKKEAERLAQLSAEERLKEELKKRDEELNNLKREKSYNELLVETQSILNQRSLPVSMAKRLMGQNAEDTLKNINEFEKEWLNEKEKVINNALKGTSPRGMTSPIITAEQQEEEKIRNEFRKKYMPKQAIKK